MRGVFRASKGKGSRGEGGTVPSSNAAYSFEKDKLVFEGKAFSPSIRTFAQMGPSLASNDSCLPPETPIYHMYRAVKRFASIRFDITRLMATSLCGEKCKTFGHTHPCSAKGGACWSEVYEVLEGSAHFLLQKVSQLGVADAVLLSANKGDRFLVPPGYGHVTINSGKGELVLANLVSDGFEADYSMFANLRGACFYEMDDGRLLRNQNYGSGFEMRQENAVKFSSQFGVYAPFAKKSLLEAAKKYADIEFLAKPETFY